MATRRRLPSKKGIYTQVDLSATDEDTRYRDYDDSDDEIEPLPASVPLKARKKNLAKQLSILLGILVFVVIFMYLVNRQNMRQLERLKEEYGLDPQKPVPEAWWSRSQFYHVYVRSFKDSNGDGIGDINGIREKISHFQYLAVDVILLSCIFESPMVDYGKDVTDFTDIDPVYGTLQDFDNLVDDIHARDLKIFLELVPNHTSKKHPWFQESRVLRPDNKYKDYYIWHSGQLLRNGTRLPPNNWISRYGGSAWTWDDDRLEYYYHYYHSSMPDLNYRDEGVMEDMVKVFRFWLDRGVDGFVIDGIHVLFEIDELVLDEPLSELPDVLPGEYRYVDHSYTEDQPDVHDFIAMWHEYLDEYSLINRKKVPLLVNVADDDITDVIKYYHTGADSPLSHALFNIGEECGGMCVYDRVQSWLDHVPDGKDPIWMMSSPDYQRVISQKGADYQNVLNMLSMLLPGAVMTYYGEEIAMEGTSLQFDQSLDLMAKTAGAKDYAKVSRDPARSPMQWSSEQHAGFTQTGRPWMPVNPTFLDVNVQKQMNDPSETSPLQIYGRLAGIRKHPSFHHGRIQFAITNDNVISFMRYAKDAPPYIIALNFGQDQTTDDYTFITGVQFGKVVTYSKGSRTTPQTKEGLRVDLEKLTLYPGEGVVGMLVME